MKPVIRLFQSSPMFRAGFSGSLACPERRVRRRCKLFWMRTVVFLALVVTAACGPKTAPLPTVSFPRFPDFVAPVTPVEFASTAAAENQSRGWTFLQAGDMRNAEHEFTAALRTPGFYPAEIGLGYVEVARQDGKAALTHFDRVLERLPMEASALVGRGEANLALNREAEALAAFEAAIAAEPALTETARRVEVLKFRVAEQQIADARAAVSAGRLDDAVREYTAAIASSPGSAFLHRELAGVERQRGDATAALARFRSALDLDPSDVASFVGIGDILDTNGDFDGAMQAYASALAIEPSAAIEAKIDAVRARAELARLPPQYREIDLAGEITRGELAALIGVRLAALLQPDPRADAEPITDVRDDWAAPWILTVARAGVLEPFANHAFEPRTLVRRVDLAQAVERLLGRIAALNPGAATPWEGTSWPFTDLAPGHLAYSAASVAVAAGVLTPGPDGSFQPSNPVSGAEAVQAIQRIQSLAGLTESGKAQR
jgi:tetratricopeptide (TPR) repeat protein